MEIIVKPISTEEAIPLRITILRDGKPEPTPHHEEDAMEKTFHLGAFHENQLIGIASFHPVPRQGYSNNGFQLRGMGVLADYQKKGIGDQILQKGLDILHAQQVEYCWCNARKIAFPFYEKMGFSFISEEFEVPIIGPHKVMIRSLV